MNFSNLPGSDRSAPTPAPRARMSAQRRRQQLIEAAQQLFSTHGFRGTSTKAIAERAGVSEALLFRHFPTKADLYAAILLEKAEFTGLAERIEILDRLAQADDDEALVRFFVQGTIENNERDLPFARLLLYAALEGHELANTSQQLFGAHIWDTLHDYIVRRQRAGAFRPGDPRLLALGIAALPAYYSLIYRVLQTQKDTFSPSAVVDLLTQMALDSVRLHAKGAQPNRAQDIRRPRTQGPATASARSRKTRK